MTGKLKRPRGAAWETGRGDWINDPLKVATARRLWDDGVSASGICVEIGLGKHQKGAILGYARRNAWPQRGPSPTLKGRWVGNPKELAEAYRMFMAGQTLDDIAAHFGATAHAIAGLQKRHKWGRRDPWFLAQVRAAKAAGGPIYAPDPPPDAPAPAFYAPPAPPPETAENRQEPPPPPTIAPPLPEPRPAPAIPIVPVRPPKACQWITSKGRPWTFCSGPAADGSVYCTEHRAKAYDGKGRRVA